MTCSRVKADRARVDRNEEVTTRSQRNAQVAREVLETGQAHFGISGKRCFVVRLQPNLENRSGLDASTACIAHFCGGGTSGHHGSTTPIHLKSMPSGAAHRLIAARRPGAGRPASEAPASERTWSIHADRGSALAPRRRERRLIGVLPLTPRLRAVVAAGTCIENRVGGALPRAALVPIPGALVVPVSGRAVVIGCGSRAVRVGAWALRSSWAILKGVRDGVETTGWRGLLLFSAGWWGGPPQIEW